MTIDQLPESHDHQLPKDQLAAISYVMERVPGPDSDPVRFDLLGLDRIGESGLLQPAEPTDRTIALTIVNGLYVVNGDRRLRLAPERWKALACMLHHFETPLTNMDFIRLGMSPNASNLNSRQATVHNNVRDFTCGINGLVGGDPVIVRSETRRGKASWFMVNVELTRGAKEGYYGDLEEYRTPVYKAARTRSNGVRDAQKPRSSNGSAPTRTDMPVQPERGGYIADNPREERRAQRQQFVRQRKPDAQTAGSRRKQANSRGQRAGTGIQLGEWSTIRPVLDQTTTRDEPITLTEVGGNLLRFMLLHPPGRLLSEEYMAKGVLKFAPDRTTEDEVRGTFDILKSFKELMSWKNNLGKKGFELKDRSPNRLGYELEFGGRTRLIEPFGFLALSYYSGTKPNFNGLLTLGYGAHNLGIGNESHVKEETGRAVRTFPDEHAFIPASSSRFMIEISPELKQAVRKAPSVIG